MKPTVATSVHKTRLFVLAAAAWAGASALAIHASPGGAYQDQASTSSTTSPDATLIQKYCVTCHNEKRKTGELVLEGVNVEKPSANAELWEKVLRKLHTGAMPPPGMPRPAENTLRAFVARVEGEIDG